MALITNDFVFIHVPKTGGTWCRKVIMQSYPDARESENISVREEAEPDVKNIAYHHGARRALAGGTFRGFFVGFVRHPFTWYASRWAWAKMTNFREKLNVNDSRAQNHWMAQVWADRFSDFIDNVIDMKVPFALVTFTEKLWLGGWIDCIGRYEALAFDLYRLTGCKPIEPVPWQKVSSITAFMSQPQRAEIGKLEQEVIRRFYP